QHARFHLLAHLFELDLCADLTEAYASPYRPGSRPLRGMVLGVHAFTAVTALRLRLLYDVRVEIARGRLFRVHWNNLFAMHSVLRHGSFGPVDRRLVGSLCARLLWR